MRCSPNVQFEVQANAVTSLPLCFHLTEVENEAKEIRTTKPCRKPRHEIKKVSPIPKLQTS